MNVEVPEPVARLLPDDPQLRRRAVLEGLVMRAYTAGSISRGRAAELLGLNYWEAEKFFSDRGISVNYDLEEFRRDQAH
jgi:predicted HTH domain antitoxin